MYLADPRKCQDLAVCNFMDCPGVTDASVIPLAEKSVDLKRVDLKGTGCTEAAVAALGNERCGSPP